MFGEISGAIFSSQGVMLLIVFVLTLYIACNLFFDVRVPDLEKRAVLITGCDSGFGYELAKKLDALGLRVFAACLTSEGEAKLTSLWAVVNNAGISFPGLIEWQTVEEMTNVVDVNVWGMVSITKAFLPLLKGTKGRVVNVASCLGRVSFPGGAAYCISKFGVQAFSDALRCEMLRFGVTVHIIEPGFFRTNITDPKRFTQHIETLWKNLDANTKESYGTAFYEKLKTTRHKSNLQRLKSPHIYKVVDAMAHAVISTRPKLRYVVGWDWILWRTLSFLPSEIQDKVLGLIL